MNNEARRAEPVAGNPVHIVLYHYRPGPPGLTKRGVSSYPALRFAAYGDKYGFGPPDLLDSNKSGALT